MVMVEQKVFSALDNLGIPYEVIEINPDFADTAAFCKKYGYPLEQSCNTIIVVSKKEPKKYVACAVLAHTLLDVNKRVRKLMGASRASFASSDEISLTGMEVGGDSFLLPAGIPLYVDERVMSLDWVIFGAGSRSYKIKICLGVLIKLVAEITTDLAVEKPSS